MSHKNVVLKRTQAACLIDEVRQALAYRRSHKEIEEMILNTFKVEPLKLCDGEAHDNLFIDNCPGCMPRWGIVGSRIKISLFQFAAPG